MVSKLPLLLLFPPWKDEGKLIRKRNGSDFLNRVKSNAAAKKEAKAKGESVVLKRLPAAPREARTVSTGGNAPQTLAPIPYG